MKDERGLYYYPTLQDRSTRMYVREQDGEVHFRLYSSENPEVWERHGWVPYSAIKQAAELYKKERDPSRNPLGLYDLDVAKRILQEE
jgi:hypothetical protein